MGSMYSHIYGVPVDKLKQDIAGFSKILAGGCSYFLEELHPLEILPDSPHYKDLVVRAYNEFFLLPVLTQGSLYIVRDGTFICANTHGQSYWEYLKNDEFLKEAENLLNKTEMPALAWT